MTPSAELTLSHNWGWGGGGERLLLSPIFCVVKGHLRRKLITASMGCHCYYAFSFAYGQFNQTRIRLENKRLRL